MKRIGTAAWLAVGAGFAAAMASGTSAAPRGPEAVQLAIGSDTLY